MTKYEVGKWYGWNNDAECPVHPETIVDVVAMNEFSSSYKNTKAKNYCWSFETNLPIIAFKIVEEYKEPMVVWVNVDQYNSFFYTYRSQKEAEAHFRERLRSFQERHNQEIC